MYALVAGVEGGEVLSNAGESRFGLEAEALYVDDADRNPSVEGRRMVSASKVDSTYCVKARGGGEINWLLLFCSSRK